MTNGWTGGQYSVFRALFGIYLGAHFVGLFPWGAELFSSRGMMPEASTSPLAFVFPNVLALFDAPAVVSAIILMAAGASLLLALGWHDRAAAVFVWYVWACLLGRNPFIANPGIPYVGWLLLAHALLPSAPYGSVAARGRTEPAGTWRMSPALFAGAWILMALGYTYSGATKLMSPSWLDGTAVARVLQNPLARPGPVREALLALPDGMLEIATWSTLGLELFFAPLALSRRLRPWVWGLALAMHLALIGVVDFADLSLGMVMLHLFTFDPAWVTALRARATETVFYDGGCGLCHGAVRFLLAEDRAEAFQFAPLGGETFRAAVPHPALLPDSLVVLTADGRTLTRSAALVHVGRRLGGFWRLGAGVAALLPASWLDRGDAGLARLRHRMSAPPPAACPVASSSLRQRLLA